MILVDLLKEVKDLIDADCSHNATALSMASAICGLMDDIVLDDPAECERLDNWHDEIKKLLCKTVCEHHWEYDNCGYWGHQYCVVCQEWKYQELGKLSCADAIAKSGVVLEEEYKPRRILSEHEITEYHTSIGCNFGSTSPVEVVDEGLLKVACGWCNGSTCNSILDHHGLISTKRRDDPILTRKGKMYLWERFKRFAQPTDSKG